MQRRMYKLVFRMVNRNPCFADLEVTGSKRPADIACREDAEAGVAKSVTSGSSDSGPRALADRLFSTWKDTIMLPDSRELTSLHIRIVLALVLVRTCIELKYKRPQKANIANRFA